MSALKDTAGDVRDEVTGLGSQLPPSRDEKDAVREFVADATSDLKALMSQELALAKAEITAETSKVGKGAGMLGGAVVAILMTLIFASIAAWWGLAHLMDTAWASLIVAGVWLLIAVVLFLLGRGVLRSISLTPQRTIDSMKRIPSAFKPAQGDRNE